MKERYHPLNPVTYFGAFGSLVVTCVLHVEGLESALIEGPIVYGKLFKSRLTKAVAERSISTDVY